MRKNFLIGKVIDIEDPKKIGRIRCEVLGHTEGLSKEMLPWYVPADWSKDTYDIPKVGEMVYIYLWDDDIHLGMWKLMERDSRFSLTEDDYKSAKILIRRYLEDWEDAGLLTIHYTKTDGLMLQLGENKINIRRNDTIHLYAAALGKQIDIVGDQISLGSLNKSDEPAVMGLKNNEHHNKQSTYIDDLAKKICSAFDELAQTASSNPYTSPLAPIWEKHSSSIKSWSDSQKTELTNSVDNDTLISHLVSLDKEP